MSPTLTTKAPGRGGTSCHAPQCRICSPGVASVARTVRKPQSVCAPAAVWGILCAGCRLACAVPDLQPGRRVRGQRRQEQTPQSVRSPAAVRDTVLKCSWCRRLASFDRPCAVSDLQPGRGVCSQQHEPAPILQPCDPAPKVQSLLEVSAYTGKVSQQPFRKFRHTLLKRHSNRASPPLGTPHPDSAAGATSMTKCCGRWKILKTLPKPQTAHRRRRCRPLRSARPAGSG